MLQKEKILVIDDDHNITQLLKELLEGEEYSVVTANTGEMGLMAFESNRPALVLLDALLPKMNGFEVVKKMRSTDHGRRIPIVMMSGIYRANKMLEQIEQLNLDDFIDKPFDLELVVTKVKELLQINVQSDPELHLFEQQGTLQQTSVPRLLFLLYRNRETGVLVVSKDKLRKRISIKKGEPTFVESNLVQECLGKLLVKKGRLSAEKCDESLEFMKLKKLRQGQALIQMGILTSSELDEALKDQAREKLLELFSWSNGDYQFFPAEKLLQVTTPVDLTLPQLLLRGVRTGFALERLKIELGDYLDKQVRIVDNFIFSFDDFRLASWDEKILSELDGTKTLRELISPKIARELDVYQLIYVFWQTNMIQFTESNEEKEEHATQIKLQRYLDELQSANFYKVLELNTDATVQAIHQAFQAKMVLYSPTTSTLNPKKNSKLRTLLTEIATIIQQAHTTLNDRKKRLFYDRQLYLTKGITPTKPENIFRIDDELARIRSAIEQGDFDDAEQYSRAMIKLFPDQSSFHAYLGWASFKSLLKRGKPTELEVKPCLDNLFEAIRLNKDFADYHFFVGSIYKHLEDMERAKSYFIRANNIDPEHTAATREARLIQMREGKKNRSFIKWK
jgi:CheY-like chemotaxis protein